MGDLPYCPFYGDSSRFVARLLLREGVLQWAADGGSLFTEKKEGMSYRVSRLDLATGRRTLWMTSTIPDSAGVAFGNFLITPDGQSYAHNYSRTLAYIYLAEGIK